MCRQCFGGIYCFHVQGLKVKHANNPKEAEGEANALICGRKDNRERQKEQSEEHLLWDSHAGISGPRLPHLACFILFACCWVFAWLVLRIYRRKTKYPVEVSLNICRITMRHIPGNITVGTPGSKETWNSSKLLTIQQLGIQLEITFPKNKLEFKMY
jgi:hypothetical protein